MEKNFRINGVISLGLCSSMQPNVSDFMHPNKRVRSCVKVCVCPLFINTNLNKIFLSFRSTDK